MNKIITVVGSVIYDFRVTAERIPKPGETLKGWGFGTCGGGKGANQAVEASLLSQGAGAETYLVANIGADSYGEEILKAYAASGLNSQYVFVDPAATTSVCLIHVGKNGENSIITDEAANKRLSAAHIEKARGILEKTSVLLIQNEVPCEASGRAIDIVKNAGGVIIFNPAPASPFPGEWYGKVDYLTPNESEAQYCSGVAINGGSLDELLPQARAAARAMIGKGAPNVIVTLGRHGSLHATKNGDEFFPAYTVDAVDTTAAGDAFNGALAVRLGEGADVRDAIKFANAAGALCASKAGSQPSLPNRAAVDGFMKS